MLTETTCCGVREIESLCDEAEESVVQVAHDLFKNDMDGAFILFTDPVKYGRGEALRKLIEIEGLGTVHHTRQKKNPNSQNMLKAYLWNFNRRELKKYYNSHKRNWDLDYDYDW